MQAREGPADQGREYRPAHSAVADGLERRWPPGEPRETINQQVRQAGIQVRRKDEPAAQHRAQWQQPSRYAAGQGRQGGGGHGRAGDRADGKAGHEDRDHRAGGHSRLPPHANLRQHRPHRAGQELAEEADEEDPRLRGQAQADAEVIEQHLPGCPGAGHPGHVGRYRAGEPAESGRPGQGEQHVRAQAAGGRRDAAEHGRREDSRYQLADSTAAAALIAGPRISLARRAEIAVYHPAQRTPCGAGRDGQVRREVNGKEVHEEGRTAFIADEPAQRRVGEGEAKERGHGQHEHEW